MQNLPKIITGEIVNRITALRQFLGYPLQQRDPTGSHFWYLKPGIDITTAEDTRPIAVGFYPQLNQMTTEAVLQFFTAARQQQEIYGHYLNNCLTDQPVMYLLLPTEVQTETKICLILPTEGRLRQRNIQCFEYNSPELWQSRLERLKQDKLPIAKKAVSNIPQVEWVFFESAKTASDLAKQLAEVTRRLEGIIPQIYQQEVSDGYLHQLLASFQQELLPNLKLQSDSQKDYSFADIYAQTIAYGLFTARVFSYVQDEKSDFQRQEIWRLLPETNPFLRNLFQSISALTPSELGDDLLDAIDEIISILKAAEMAAILSDFREKMNREDIVIRFYEDFLAAYKPQMRELRGVYYTPEPVVSYIVRSVDLLIQEKFNKPLGIADPEIIILDPACGTGTFILYIFKLIKQRFDELPELLTIGLTDKSWHGYVKERLLTRIYGFELLMAPYAICHLKLGLFLEETGYKFEQNQRLGVYLTNTLDDVVKK